MLGWHLRQLLLLLSIVLISVGLAACGSGGDDAGTPGPVTPPPVTTGSLAVSASGLPAGINAALRITGPNNYLQDLTQPQTLSGLAPGSYTVAATPVTTGGVTYQPAPASQAAPPRRRSLIRLVRSRSACGGSGPPSTIRSG
jgi:hypothetical protein